MLTYNLASDGYETTSVLNARTAAEKLNGNEYDLVLLDINLPDGNGYDLCRLVKPSMLTLIGSISKLYSYKKCAEHTLLAPLPLIRGHRE